jgi:hypothetical protein
MVVLNLEGMAMKQMGDYANEFGRSLTYASTENLTQLTSISNMNDMIGAA